MKIITKVGIVAGNRHDEHRSSREPRTSQGHQLGMPRLHRRQPLRLTPPPVETGTSHPPHLGPSATPRPVSTSTRAVTMSLPSWSFRAGVRAVGDVPGGARCPAVGRSLPDTPCWPIT